MGCRGCNIYLGRYRGMDRSCLCKYGFSDVARLRTKRIGYYGPIYHLCNATYLVAN